MAPGIDNEKRWAFLKPWTKVLKHQLSSPRQPKFTALYAFVVAPTQEKVQKLQEGLKLLAAVAHVDYDAWMYLLEKHCKLEREKSWDNVIEKEMLVGFQLDIESPHFVQMWGIQQHDRPSPEYSEALARIAAMDQNLHTKECGVEIPVLLEPFFEVLGPEDLDKLSRLHNAVKMIRREWEEESLSFIAAGTFRCTFVMSVTNVDLSQYYPIDLEMVKKVEELVHDNVWFSSISLPLDFDNFRDRRPWKEILGRILRTLFDSTRRSNESPTRYLETKRYSKMVDQISISLYELPLNEWGALCSAVMHSQTMRVLELLYVGSCWQSNRWWEWLAYGFFSKKAQSLSSLESLALRHIESMTISHVKAFHEILSSEYYEEALLGFSGGSGRAQHATLAANSPIRWFVGEQNEPVLGSEVLKSATPISFLRMNSESGWIDAIVPGFGRCQIRCEDLVLSEHVNILPVNNLKTLEIHFARSEHSIKTVDISGLPFFLTAVGSFLKKLTIDTGTSGIVVEVKMVLERCPNLEQLCLKTNHDIAVLDFSEYQVACLTLPGIIFNLGDLPAFTEELMNTDSALSNCLQSLTIYQGYPYCPTELRKKFEAVLKILERNERLEYLHIQMYDEFDEYTERFLKFHLRPTKHSAKLDFRRKIAFLSVVSTTIPPRSDKMKRERYMGKKRMNWDQLGADVMTSIFLFAATPVRLRVYVGGPSYYIAT